MADTNLTSASRAQLYGKQAIKESYASAETYDGLVTFITDKEVMMPEAGYPIVVNRAFASTEVGGYRVNVPFIGKITGEGVDGDATQEDNEAPIHNYNFYVDINQKRQAARSKGRMDEQRGNVKLMKRAKPLLSDWYKDIRNKEITRKLAGATSKTFSNTPTASTTNRTLYGGTSTSTADITSSSKFDLSLIQKTRVVAKNEYLTGTDGQYIPPIGRIKMGGKRMYSGLYMLHPEVYYDLVESDRVQQLLRECATYQKDNPLIQAGDFVYADIICRSCEYLREPSVGEFSTWGAGADQPGAINLFIGQHAVAIAETKDPRIVEDKFDYNNKLGYCIDNIWGVQKYLYNGEDLGCIAAKTYRTDL